MSNNAPGIPKWTLLFVMAALLVACDAPPQKVRLGGADLRSPVVSPYETPALPKPPESKPKLNEERLKDYNKLLDDFEKRADVAFTRPDTQQHLPGIERFYVDTSRVFDMAKLYRKAYDKHGPTHYIGPRLAWTYLYLNDTAKAREVLDQAKAARPDDALVHFIEGSLIPRESQGELEIAVAVRDAWTECLRLDPNFKGPLGVSAQILRMRLNEINKMIKRAGGPAAAPKTPAPAPTPAVAPGEKGAVDPDLVRAESLLAAAKYLDAAEAFRTVLTKDPKTLPDTINTQRRAQVGFAVAAWRHEGKLDRDKASLALDLAAARPDLTPQELFDLFEIYAKKLKMRDKASALAERLKKADPAMAAAKKVDDMLPPAK